ncbi:hypothetical protein CLI64_06320 [Nostoc sp. CENA543]|nr:hypothetical protein CLI64_06320 [Nostoc sp. CENA543]
MGIGHWALGIGHWALGIGNRYLILTPLHPYTPTALHPYTPAQTSLTACVSLAFMGIDRGN